MKKAVSILLVLLICLSMTVTVFATNNDEFVGSPGESGKPCDHNHTVVENKKDPSCTEAGHTGKEVCQDCGEIVEPGKVIPSTGHNFEDKVCTICGSPYQPTTGDISILPWVILIGVAVAALVVITVIYRKKA